MEERLQAFDILRVAATLSVIAIHITAIYAAVLPAAYFANQFVRYAVPLFIIMSGYLIYFTDSRKGFIPVASFYRKRVTKILWPYIIWTLVYTLFSMYTSGSWPPLKAIGVTLGYNLLLGNAFYHLYFLPIIFQLYLIYPLLRLLMKKPELLLIVALVMTLTGQTLFYLNKANVFGFYLSIPVWVFYFVLGMYVYMKQEAIRELLCRHAAVLGMVWLVALTILIIDGRMTATYSSSIKPSVVLYTTVSFFFFFSLALRVKPGVGRWLSWVANQSFLIFLMHPLVLTLLCALPPRLGWPYLWSSSPGIIALYLATAVFTVIGAYILSFTPLTTWLGGQSRSPSA